METFFNNTVFIGKVAKHLIRVDSTNNYAKKLVSKSPPIDGTVIYTDEQYAGRGQIDSQWISQAGQNITMSIIFRPKFLNVSHQFRLSQAISIAIALYFKQILPNKDVKIKWPNDIYIENKKIGGILIENILKGKIIDFSIVGIGLNINQSQFHHSIQKATSLYLESNKKFDLSKIITEICTTIEFWYFKLKNHQYSIIQLQYLSLLYRYQEIHEFIDLKNASYFTGKITDIKHSGQIEILNINKNKKNIYNIKEISFKI